MEEIAVAGDGLAGLMLAQALRDREREPIVYGDGQTNTPTLGLVHLFAGRSFRRHRLEVEAFRVAVEFWSRQDYAREHQVTRSLVPGDRLDRSLEASRVPERYRPARCSATRVRYSPGFSIAAQSYLAGLVEQTRIVPSRLGAPSGLTVWATGTDFEDRLKQVRWDRSEGRLVEVEPGVDEILIGEGVHLAPHPFRDATVLGGSGTREIEAAERLAERGFKQVEVWQGRRLAAALDRWPVMGWLRPGEFLFGGFGSRALFWLPWAVQVAASAIVDGVEVPREVHWRRLI